MSDRLGGKSRRPINDVKDVSKLHTHVLPDMATALKQARRPFWSRTTEDDIEAIKRLGNRPVTGDPERLKASLSKAELFVEEAIAYDPRLARKAEWKRRDEGEHVCAGLLAEGDDQPFYKRERHVVNDATNAGEPLKIVISTDDPNVLPDTAAAFIATARLVQQFMPLQIWWQGAWLDDGAVWNKKGFIFQVPLVSGDMDFSRLEFCIADDRRDYFSYLVMASHAILDIKESWNSCGHRAEKAYKSSGEIDYSSTTKFITHHGILPSVESVANHAAEWLGWREAWLDRVTTENNQNSAGQEIPQPYTATGITDADRRRWERERKDAETKSKREAASRLQNV